MLLLLLPAVFSIKVLVNNDVRVVKLKFAFAR